jgi:hypothetical protein
MVEGRPDWVLSRQRAWGVPITLFVDRKTGEYLVDPEVNARIVAAVREAASTPGPRTARRLPRHDYAPTITSRSPTSSTSGSIRGCTHASCSKAALADCAGPPTSTSKARTSTAAGSSRRCSKAAPPAAARLTRRS